MENPNYIELFELYRLETDPVARQELLEQIYQFNTPLTPEEIDLFNYFSDDYVINNPGIQGNSFSSYIGVYFNQQGENTGEYS